MGKDKDKSKSRKRRKSSRDRSRSRSGSREKDRGRDENSRQKKPKRKKSRSRSRSSSASSSPGSHSGNEAVPQTVKERLQQKEISRDERRKEKEAMKAYETPEEKRARRLAKKQQKELKRRQKMGWDKEHIGYTNSDNPFGDSNLLSTFVWAKKEEQQNGTARPSTPQTSVDTIAELEKVKKRRMEREREKAMRQEEIQNDQRDREKAYFAQWESQEDSFHLGQAKPRSTIRIQDGRAKPIDLLAKYISTEEEDQQLAVEMHDPQKFLEGLPMADLEDLLEDIKVYMELEQGKNAEYWKDITIVVHDEITRLNQNKTVSIGDERRGTLNANVATEVNKIFKGKTEEQLLKLKSSIEHKLQTQTNIDTIYWESLLRKLVAHTARVRLHDRHQEALRQKLFKLKHEQGVQKSDQPLFPIGQQPSSSSVPSSSKQNNNQLDETEVEEYDSGRYSPRLVQPSDLPPDTVFLDPSEELNKLLFAREKFIGTGSAEVDADKQLMQKARESGLIDETAEGGASTSGGAGGEEGEAAFTGEQAINKTYQWADKYRPRKPRYFNRVHTGYEWNKYNQTHYDPENPPPKIVQGYKFNIFYPDLIDKRQTPRFEVTPLPDEPDFCVLRFSSGPPYEDIGFKIVNREWEYGHKHGYKCQFSNDIFQLWFKFKIYKYRR